jgi:Zn finger protein HypA/HybF involved in hydrogenase expression
MPRKKTKLAVIAEPPADASVVHLENAPFLKGKERENLLCGSCGLVICKGVSAESCTSKFSAPVELLVRCPKCGSHNRLSAKVGD